MEKETIFREGDRVFDYLHGGWGSIENIRLGSLSVHFKERTKMVRMSIEEAEERLSFTKYDLVNGGFSQERPMLTISMPYLESKWIYLTFDEHGVFIWARNPIYCKTKGRFLGSSRHGVDFQTVNGIICIDDLEKNTVYKIIDKN